MALSNIFLIVNLEFFLKILNHILVKLEGLRENIRINGRIGSKDSIRYCDYTCILATETSNGNCIGFSHIELEVYETNRKDKHIPLV